MIIVNRARRGRSLLLAAGISVLVVILLALLTREAMGFGPGMMWGYGYGRPAFADEANGWAWGLAMGVRWLLMLALWGAVLSGAVLMTRALRGSKTNTGINSEPALAVLRRRFASGEIAEEEYQQRRKVLES